MASLGRGRSAQREAVSTAGRADPRACGGAGAGLSPAPGKKKADDGVIGSAGPGDEAAAPSLTAADHFLAVDGCGAERGAWVVGALVAARLPVLVDSSTWLNGGEQNGGPENGGLQAW